ncbi:hypothetical protein EIN_052620 [Entamoeba invadens IP1]|uniref:hypothetical protein n=1 Tax=Entamoeba invadens IP1 TaxID=370355 RepID=UPI0002C3E5DF|nr:hypothetical protein EIN_052620 [Entamoeba invadens IP1]ELP93047.1 hypothetical protein EIN_052620 [Entamoeba invadens IP1]|eukprot:XP_004259818.1 hypothetical protein EIN_052620 [Entamoeba invadens IP1]
MFSPTTQQLGLLQLNAHTNILSVLSKEVQVSVITNISEHIFKNMQQFQSSLSTEEHCKWFMEVIGAGLRLSVECFQTIENCYNIYESWFMLRENAPGPVQLNFNEFRKTALDHITLMLCKRESSLYFQHFPKYCELCKRAVNMIRTIAKSLDPNSEETSRLFKLVIGCVEDVCGTEWRKEDAMFMMPIANILIKTFYEMWVEQSYKDPALCKTVLRLHKKWINVSTVALEWVKLSVVIQKTCLDTIYITKTGRGTLSLNNEDYHFSLTTTTPILFKTWMQFLHFVGNIANIKEPDVLELIEEGFYNLVVLIMEYSFNKTLTNPPDVNLILSIFLNAISFPVLYLPHQNYREAILLSLKTLFLIIETYIFVNTIEENYMVCIFNMLASFLDSTDNSILVETLVRIPQLFEKRFPGIEVLYPNLLSAFERYSTTSEPNKAVVQAILSSLQIIQFSFSPERRAMMITSIPRKSTKPYTHELLIQKTRLILFRLMKIVNDPFSLEALLFCFNKFFMDYISRSSDSKQIDDNSPEFLLDEFLKVLTVNGLNWIQLLVGANKHLSFIDLCRTLYFVIPNLSVPHIPMQQLFGVVSNYIELNFKTTEDIHPFLSVFALLFAKSYASLPTNVLMSTLRLCSKICTYFNESKDTNILGQYRFDADLMAGLSYSLLPPIFKDVDIDEKSLLPLFIKNNVKNPLDYFRVFYNSESILTYVNLPWTKTNRFTQVLFICRTLYNKYSYTVRYIDDTEEWKPVPYSTCENNVEIGTKPYYEENEWDVTKPKFDVKKFTTIEVAKQIGHPLKLPSFDEIDSTSNVINCSTARLFAMNIHTTQFSRSALLPLVVSDKLLDALVELDNVSTKIPGCVTIKTELNTELFINFVDNIGKFVNADTFIGFKGDYDNGTSFVTDRTTEFSVVYNVPSIYQTPQHRKYGDDVVIEWRILSETSQLKNVKEDKKLMIIIEQDRSDILRVISNKIIGPLKLVQFVGFDILPILLRLAVHAFLKSQPLNSSQTARRHAIEKVSTLVDDKNPHGEIRLLFNTEFCKTLNTSKLNFITEELDILPCLHQPTHKSRSPLANSLKGSFNSEDDPSPLNTPNKQIEQVLPDQQQSIKLPTEKPAQSLSVYKKLIMQQEKQQQQVKQIEKINDQTGQVVPPLPQPTQQQQLVNEAKQKSQGLFSSPRTRQMQKPQLSQSSSSLDTIQSPQQTQQIQQHTSPLLQRPQPPQRQPNIFGSAPIVSSFQKKAPKNYFATKEDPKIAPKANVYPQFSAPVVNETKGQYSYQTQNPSPQKKTQSTYGGWQMAVDKKEQKGGRNFVMGDRRSKDITSTVHHEQ